MGLIHLVIVLIVVGVLLWLFNHYVVKIDGTIKAIINWTVIIATILWVLNVFGIFAHDVPVPRVH